MLRPFAHPVACCCVLPRAKGRNIVGQQLPTLLYACHVNRLKLWVTDPRRTTGDNGDLTRPMRKISDFYEDKYGKSHSIVVGWGAKRGVVTKFSLRLQPGSANSNCFLFPLKVRIIGNRLYFVSLQLACVQTSPSLIKNYEGGGTSVHRLRFSKQRDSRVFHPGGGGGSPMNRLYRCVPHKRVCFFYPFWSI